MSATDGNGASRPTASGSEWTKLSEFYPYGDAPPRLCAALNDTPTDTSDNCRFEKRSKPRRKPAGSKETPPSATPTDVPRDDIVPDDEVFTAKTITRVTDWVAGRLQTGLGLCWLSQAAQFEQWTPDGKAEGVWASVMAELFLGATYLGPGQTYLLGHPLEVGDSGVLQPRGGKKTGSFAPAAWEPWMFRRLERRWRRYADDPIDIVSWDMPVAHFDMDVDGVNDDPAIPIGTACQHLTTYVVVSRGFTVDVMGNATMGGMGLSASDGCFSLPLFSERSLEVVFEDQAGSKQKIEKVIEKARPVPTSYDHKYAKQAKDPSTPLRIEAPAGGKTILPSDEVLKVSRARGLGLGPGSIVVYDPDRGAETNRPLYMSPWEEAHHGPDPVKIWGKFLKTRKTNKSINVGFASWTDPNRPRELPRHLADLEQSRDVIWAKINKRPLPPQPKPKPGETSAPSASPPRPQPTPAEQAQLDSKDKEIAAAKAAIPGDEAVKVRKAIAFPGTRQFDGSHIFAILRVHPTKDLVQYLDVNGDGHLGELRETGSDSLLLRQGGAGVVDGAAGHGAVYDMNHAFAGYGVLPPHEMTFDQVTFLRKARPIGLARLALTVRPQANSKGQARMLQKDDVLFVSAMFRMYGDGPEENHYLSHLLWALRNSPGFTNVQPWWFVYAPRGLLAKCMWAPGARSMKIGNFLQRHRPEGDGLLDPEDLLLNVVLSNEGDANRAGHCALYCRFKSRPDGSTTVTSFEPGPPPSPLMALVDPQKLRAYQAAKRSLNWNQTYVHPKIELDLRALPKMFVEGG